MKKIILSASAILVTLVSGAQDVNVSQAMNLMDNDYFGSARSAALGNAMTALGSDLGSMQINPAGTSVAKYSQIVISPVLSITTVNSTYAPVADYYGAGTGVCGTGSNTRVSSAVPNWGTIFNIDTRGRTVKNVAIGVSMLTTMLDKSYASIHGGDVNYTSYMGALAYGCDGISCYDLAGSYSNNIYWPCQLGYKAAMIRNVGDYDDVYAGASEVYDGQSFRLGGDINQYYNRSINGFKQDLIFNASFNIKEKLYLGMNIAVPILNYSGSWQQEEIACNPGDFEYQLNGRTVHFQKAGLTSWEKYSGVGVNAKFGLLYVPVRWLRLGAAIQTPTVYNINRYVQWDGYTGYDTGKYSGTTPEGTESFKLSSPFRYNLGAAFVIGKSLLLSVDWEEADFKNMKYTLDSSSATSEVNAIVNRDAGKGRQIRAGIEYKPLPSIAVRGGYNRTTRTCYNEDEVFSIWSLGFGYSSNDAFYLDFVARFKNDGAQWWYPYDDYCDIATPEVSYTRKSVDLMVTLGFRF